MAMNVDAVGHQPISTKSTSVSRRREREGLARGGMLEFAVVIATCMGTLACQDDHKMRGSKSCGAGSWLSWAPSPVRRFHVPITANDNGVGRARWRRVSAVTLIPLGFGKRLHSEANDRFGFSLHVFGRQFPQFEASVERGADIGADQDTRRHVCG